MPKQPATPVHAPRAEATPVSSDDPSAIKRDQPDSRDTTSPAPESRPPEYGGRNGPDPVRYGDWEKNGRCIDF